MMKRLWTLPVVLMLAMLCLNDAKAGDNSGLAFELSNLRDAWLEGDDNTAAARLDVLMDDDRLGGSLPRWYAFLRATLEFDDQDDATILTIIDPVLQDARDPRDYIRAARLFMGYARFGLALDVIEAGLLRDPDSLAMLRFKAGLQWLGGDHDAGINTYLKILAMPHEGRANYPFVSPNGGRWSELPTWEDQKNFAGKPVGGKPEEPTFEEPFASPFMPIHWYRCDLPGLDRCIAELGADKETAAGFMNGLPEKLNAGREAQKALDNYRGGDAEARAKLQETAATTRWKATIATRVVSTSLLAQDDAAKAETFINQGLELAPEDVSLLDLLAMAYGQLGKAEENRTGPLSLLRNLAGLSISVGTVVRRGPARQAADRVFMPALSLYRVNPEAGNQQFAQLRNTFSSNSRRRDTTFPSVLGLWLTLQGETELARKHLLEASRLNGHDSGRPLYTDAMYVESALLYLGEGEPAEEGEDEEGAVDEGEEEQPENGEEEVDPVALAKIGDAHPLLRRSQRVGGVMGGMQNTRDMIRQYSGVDLWGGSSGIAGWYASRTLIPDGEAHIHDTLFTLPGKIAEEVKPVEIEAFLHEEHATTTTLRQALEGMVDSLEQFRQNGNWRVRNAISQKAGPIFGMVEARCIVLRAKLRNDAPKDLTALTEWMKANTELVDLRKWFQTTPSEQYLSDSKARATAGIPEVVHNGLLIDAAKLLAHDGKFDAAARLIWHNRGNSTGLETREHLLALGALFADKADNALLASRCRVSSAASAMPTPSGQAVDPTRHMLELKTTRESLLEFGDIDDVLRFAENSLIPTADTERMRAIENTIPEIREARPTLVMRNTSETGMRGIFAATIKNASCSVVVDNWYKMMVDPATYPVCERFAAWAIASDLPFTNQRGGFNGMVSTADCVAAWKLRRTLLAKQAESDESFAQPLNDLTNLLIRTATDMDEEEESYDEYWD